MAFLLMLLTRDKKHLLHHCLASMLCMWNQAANAGKYVEETKGFMFVPKTFTTFVICIRLLFVVYRQLCIKYDTLFPDQVRKTKNAHPGG